MTASGGEDLAGLLDDQVAFYGAVAAEYDDHALPFPGGAELSEALDAFRPTADLQRQLERIGWHITVRSTSGPFFWGSGSRAPLGQA